MDVRDEKNLIFNIRLAKCIGLYQILDPGTMKCSGKNIFHIAVAFIIVYSGVVSMIFTANCLYCCTDNIPMSLDYFWKAEITVFISYKMWIVVHHSDEMWNCLSITRYDFTSSSLRDRHILDRWRERSMRFTNIFTITYLSSMAIYVASIVSSSEVVIPIKNHDGTVGNYRQNLLNFHLFVSDETYNAHYKTFFFVEGFSCISMSISFVVFYILLMTLCLAISCQMQMICVAFESVGHKSIHDSHSPIGDCDLSDYNKGCYAIGKKKSSNEHDLIYDELKTIVMDHQVVMKKYEEFLALFEQVMLIQVFVSSLLLIILWFIFIMSFSDLDSFVDSKGVIKDILGSILSITIQILMQCYLFDNLHNQKDSIIFALYSSNWTEMDMKCKKLILLTMRMNNANQKKLKYTRTKIVNLEMFFKTMGDCYKIISVLINYIKTKNE